MNLESKDQKFNAEVIKDLKQTPTLVIALSIDELMPARELSALLNTRYAVSVDSAIKSNEREELFGVVSGTDDLAFIDSSEVQRKGLSTDQLQSMTQQARLQAVREAKNLSRSSGLIQIPSTLEDEIVLCVSTHHWNKLSHYRVSLLKNRNPKSLIFIGPCHPDCCSLKKEGIIQDLLPTLKYTGCIN